MRYRRLAMLALLMLAAAFAKKKRPDDTTQTLALPKDPPAVAVGETSRLVFHVSPLSPKGLLSQQTREALKAILKANGGAPVVHLRAFVAGSGDLRRVPQIVSEVFTEKKLPLPSVSVLQAGVLSTENAQIVIEAVSISRKEVNAKGLAFIEGQTAPSLDLAIQKFSSRLAGAAPLRVTCFASSLAGSAAVAARFPAAAVNIVQPQRLPTTAEATCEGVAAGSGVQSAKLAFTGTRVAFGTDEKAATLAFQRLDRDLTDAGFTPADMVATSLYALSARLGEFAGKARPATPGAVTTLAFEGVASADGSFAVDAVAGGK